MIKRGSDAVLSTLSGSISLVVLNKTARVVGLGL